MKRLTNKYDTTSTFSRMLVFLLAVFYVSVLLTEATHTHESHAATVSSEGDKSGAVAGDCKICAYVAHHGAGLVTPAAGVSFALFLSSDEPTVSPALADWYKATVQQFINRGPPYSSL